MFSHEPRCIYSRNPLGEVICQLRFPEILVINAHPPADFQEAIRDTFPKYTALREPVPGRSDQAQTINYQFSTQDGAWRVNLTSRFISLACSRYSRWEEFAKILDKPLAAFIQQYRPAYFERVGLRYLNFISRRGLGLEGVPFSELIRPCYLGPPAEEDMSEGAASRCCIDAELGLPGGCKVKLHAGPGLIKRNGQQDSEIKFIFDQDLFLSGNVPVNVSAGALEALHRQAYPIFRGAVTKLLHEAMEPELP